MSALSFRTARLAAGALIAAAIASPSSALTINLIDQGGVTGSAAEQGFRYAASYWEHVLTNNVTVNLGVGYSALGTGIIGSTGSTRYEVATQDVIGALHAVGNSALDASAVLPTLTAGTFNDPTFGAVHGINMVRNGARAGNNGINLTTAQYDMTVTRNNARLAVTEANLKALGYTGFSTATNDANITFSSAFSFDFDPTNGIAAGQMDFIGVAIHEIGHALGFTSGVDLYDQYSGTGPGAATGNGVNWNNQTAGSVLDLFRYSTDPLNAAPGTGPVLDWSVGTASYFSLDGGLSQFNGGSLFSTGAYNGDGRQASHFKDTPSPAGCDGFNQIGIMDPTFCYGEMGVITVIDIAGFDAMGWNTSIDVMANLGYKTTTAAFVTSLLAPVPEPASWAMMLGGFGLVGFGIRRRKSMALTAWPLLPTDRLPCFGGTIDRQSLDGQAPLRSRSSSFSFTGRP